MWFEILEDGKIVKAIMKDEVIEVPNTGVNDSHIIDIIGLVFITGGVGFIIYDKKRKTTCYCHIAYNRTYIWNTLPCSMVSYAKSDICL